jgi:hypothetical protein
MKSRSSILSERSLNSTLSAIEIYNKPNFADREQVFAVLLVIGWEVLLKAEILRRNGNRLNSIWVKDGGRYKRNRAGVNMTISISEALRVLKLDPVVEANISRLVEIRDAAVHLTAQSKALPYLTYTLGAASLRNYCSLAEKWFGMDIARYNFYILPLGFSYPFRTLKLAQVSRESTEIQSILKLVIDDQSAGRTQSGDFHLICEIETHLVSAKKITTWTDITAAVAQPGQTDVAILRRNVNRLDQYPLSFTQLSKKLRNEIPAINQNDVLGAIKKLKIKDDERYSAFSYRTKQDEEKGPNKNTPVIYNDDAFKALRSHLKQSAPKGR